MAEAKSSGETEDILSSIRRLVAEDMRPAQRPEIVVRPEVKDKLILTPAWRVVSRSVPHQPPLTQPQPTLREFALPDPAPVSAVTSVPAPLPRLHLKAGLDLPRMTPDVVASLTQAVNQQALDWDSETGDPAPGIESLDWSTFTFARRPPNQTWRPHQPHQSVTPTGVTPDAFAQPDPDQAAYAPLTEALLAKFAAFEAPMAEDVPEIGPEIGPEFRPEIGPELEPVLQPDWADKAEAEVLDQLSAPNAELMPGTAQQDDNIFSEQVLRELVRDLIREQLQGDLGERITRNIRKLIKAEIARTIDVRTLD